MKYETNLTNLFMKFREIAEDHTLPIPVGELGSFENEYVKNWK